MSIRERACKSAKNGKVFEVRFTYNDYGVTKRYSKSGFKSYKEAELHEAKMRTKFDKDGGLKKEVVKTLDIVFDEFLEVGSNQYQYNTIKDTTSAYNSYLRDTLGKRKINTINYQVLQRYFNSRSEEGIESNKKIKKAINRIFNYAIKVGYIEVNPVQLVDISGVENHKENASDVLSYDDFNRVITALVETGKFNYKAYAIAVQIGYYTGLRISEVLALEKTDFNFITNQITIDKKLIYRGLKKEELKAVNQMKSKTSKSVIPLAIPLKEVLADWFRINPYKIVVCDEQGNYLIPKAMSKSISSCIKPLGLRFHYHELRHTFATNLVTNNVDLKTTQELMRHANISTTMNIYTHINDEHKQEVINNVFSNPNWHKIGSQSQEIKETIN